MVLHRLFKAELRFHRSTHTKWTLNHGENHTHTHTPVQGQMKSSQEPDVTKGRSSDAGPPTLLL